MKGINCLKDIFIPDFSRAIIGAPACAGIGDGRENPNCIFSLPEQLV